MRPVSQVVHRLIESGARTATKFVSPTMTIRATHRAKPRRGAKKVELVLTIGRPNHEARQVIARAKKAGESFPLKGIRLKPWPKKRARRSATA
jgi:hypothetical protein